MQVRVDSHPVRGLGCRRQSAPKTEPASGETAAMSDRIRAQLKNRGERYTREIAEAQLKRIGLTLADDFFPKRPATAQTQEVPAQDPHRRGTGGSADRSDEEDLRKTDCGDARKTP